MPPKAKITKEMILNTVLEITRETVFEAVNARSKANKLRCSTRPIYTCYENIEELKIEFLVFAYECYEQYIENYRNRVKINQCYIFPFSYLEFAQEETYLFQLLFINEMDLNMIEAKDFYQEMDNEKRAKIFSDTIGIELERAKQIFLNLFLYSHGIVVLTVTKKLTLNRDHAEKMVRNVLSVFIRQEKSDGKLSI